MSSKELIYIINKDLKGQVKFGCESIHEFLEKNGIKPIGEFISKELKKKNEQ